MGKVTKVRLPEKLEAALASFMAGEGIGLHDKNAVISRAVEIYLLHCSDFDTGLSGILKERSKARSEKGKEIWQKSKPSAGDRS